MNGEEIAAEDVFLAMLRATLPSVEPVEGLAFFQQSALARLAVIIERFGGALLADEIGLGKSFVAAALARRYQERGVAVELIAPASLHQQWEKTLQSFGVTAMIEHTESLHRRPWMRAETARLIIVDEAHRFRNRKTAGYRALALRCIGQHLLLVTASPFWNRLDDIHSLLALFLADDALRLRGILSLELAFDSKQAEQIEAILDEVMVRRGRRALADEFRIGSLQNRVVRHRVFGIEAARPLIETLQFPLIAHSNADRTLLSRFLLRRLESSLEAFRDTLSRQRRFYRRAEESMREGRSLTKRDYRMLYGDDREETPFQELLFRDLWISQPASVREASLVHREMDVIDQLLSIERGEKDPKLGVLLHLLANLSGPSIIFTGAIATAQAIHKECAGIHRAALVTSRFAADARGSRRPPEAILAAFRRREIDLIVSTDRSSEGLNLQVASNVIHYDLPWSPLRLDQRNGRAHRIGQVSDVTAWYFMPGSSESAVMKVMAGKNRARRAVFRKERRPDAYSRWWWIERSFRSPNLEIEGKSFGGIESGIAILLIERITGSRKSRELVLNRNGSITDSWKAIAAAVSGLSACATPGPECEFTNVADLIESRARTLALLPPRLPNTCAGRRLHQEARRCRLLTGELETLLAVRYPAGIERILQEMSSEYLDLSRMAGLLSLLRSRPITPLPLEVRVIASLSLRAAEIHLLPPQRGEGQG